MERLTKLLCKKAAEDNKTLHDLLASNHAKQKSKLQDRLSQRKARHQKQAQETLENESPSVMEGKHVVDKTLVKRNQAEEIKEISQERKELHPQQKTHTYSEQGGAEKEVSISGFVTIEQEEVLKTTTETEQLATASPAAKSKELNPQQKTSSYSELGVAAKEVSSIGPTALEHEEFQKRTTEKSESEQLLNKNKEAFFQAVFANDIKCADRYLAKFPELVNVQDVRASNWMNGTAYCFPSKHATSLIYAAMAGNEPCIHLLLGKGADKNAQDSHKLTALMWASRNKKWSCVEALAKYGAKDLPDPNSFGTTALMKAIENQQFGCIELLIKSGAYISEINRSDNDGVTILMKAAMFGCDWCLQAVLKAGIDPNEQDKNGMTAVLHASMFGCEGCLQALLEAGSDPNVKDNNGMTAIMHASHKQEWSCVEVLAKFGAEDLPNPKNHNRTALIEAAKCGKDGCVKLLLSGGTAVDAQDNDGCTALNLAAYYGYSSCAQILLEAKACIDFVDSQKRTALTWAAKNENWSCVEALARAGAKDFQDTRNGITALMQAIRCNQLSCVEALATAGAKDCQVNGITPLMQAAFDNQWVFVEVLAKAGSKDLPNQDYNDRTALMMAADARKWSCVEALAKAGSEDRPNPNSSGTTALMLAATCGEHKCVMALLNAGANVDMQSNDGMTAMMLTAIFGKEECLKALLDAGANKDMQNNDGMTALILASGKGNDSCAVALMTAGASIETKNNHGMTALMMASMFGCDGCLQALLEIGADVKDNNGMTAIMHAISKGYPSITEKLLWHGCNVDPTCLQIAKLNAFSEVASVLAMKAGEAVEACFLKQGCFYPVYVCPRKSFLGMKRLKKHEIALAEGRLVKMPENAVTLFFSHRWLAGQKKLGEGKYPEEGPHPDTDENMKYNAMCFIIVSYFPRVTHVWVDYICIPQWKEHSEFQLLAINSLPYIVRKCTHFVVLCGESGVLNEAEKDEASFEVYLSRGWCRLECLSAAAPFQETKTYHALDL